MPEPPRSFPSSKDRPSPSQTCHSRRRVFGRAGVELPQAFARAARLSRAGIVHLFPVDGADGPAGSLELYSREEDLSKRERALARLAAAHLSICLRLAEALQGTGNGRQAGPTLETLAGALAAGSDEAETAEHIVRLAVGATGAAGALLWRIEPFGPPAFLAAHGLEGRLPDFEEAVRVIEGAIERRDGNSSERPESTVVRSRSASLRPALCSSSMTALWSQRTHRASRRSLPAPQWLCGGPVARRSVQDEPRRSQTLIAVVGQAIAQLSLAHTLETAVERVAELDGERSRWPSTSARRAARPRPPPRRAPGAARGSSPSACWSSRWARSAAAASSRSRSAGRDPRLAGLAHAVAEAGIAAGAVRPARRPRRRDRSARASTAAGPDRTGTRSNGSCSLFPASWRSRSRTRGCTSGRRSSDWSSSARSSPSARRHASCGASTRSRARSPRASRSTPRSTPSRRRWSSFST